MSFRAQMIGLLFLAMSSGGCGAASDEPTHGAGGSSSSGGGSAGTAGSPVTGGGTSAAMGGGAAGVGGASTIGGGGAAADCPELPVARRSTGTVLELPIHPSLQGKPLLFGQPNPLSNGGALTPLDLRFYISQVALLRPSAELVRVDLVTADGSLAPYGVHLYSADDVTSNTLRVLAPPGDYVGIQFVMGLTLPCNDRSPDASKAPLSATSQMSWPHTGFLFLRYQGRTESAATGGTGGAGPGGSSGSGGAESAGIGGLGGASSAGSSADFPAVIHMGGSLSQDLAPMVRVLGSFSIPADGPYTKSMAFVLDEVFKGALKEADLTGFMGPPGAEVVLGEHLRRNMADLHPFSFEQ